MRYVNLVSLVVIVACCISIGLLTALHVATWIVHATAWAVYAISLIYTSATVRRSLVRIGFVTLIPLLIVLSIYPNVFSDDANRYVWDGWVSTHGIDPYKWAPHDSELYHLHFTDGETYPNAVSYPWMKTVYPPGAQLTFAVASIIAGPNRAYFKIVFWLLQALGLLVVFRLCKDEAEKTWLLVATLSPIVLLHGFMDLHIDLLMALLTMMAIFMSRRGRPFTASAILALAFTLKFLPILALPILLRGKSSKERLSIISVMIVVVGAVYAPFIGPDILGSLPTFALKWQTNSWLYSLIIPLFVDHKVRLIMMGMAILGVGIAWLYQRSQPVAAFVLSIIIILLCSPVVHPWYAILPMMLFPLAPLRSTLTWGATMAAYGIGLASYKDNGVWIDHSVVLAIEFIPVLIALAYDLKYGPLLLREEHRLDSIATA